MEIVNSCEKNNGGCSHHCEHTTNGPLCSCNHGFQLDRDRKTCVGETVCLCSFFSSPSSTLCLFLRGYLLKPTLTRCVPSSDSDECASRESCCRHFCKNYAGGYECSCRAGYRLNPDGCGCDGEFCLFGSSLPNLLLFSVFYVVVQLCKKQIFRAHLLTYCIIKINPFKAILQNKKGKQKIFLTTQQNLNI